MVNNFYVNKTPFTSLSSNISPHAVCCQKYSQRKYISEMIPTNQHIFKKVAIFERYVSLAHMATRSGDNALAETYYQRAEHVLRSDRDNGVS